MPDLVVRVTESVLPEAWRLRLRIMLGTALLKYLADLHFTSRYTCLPLVFTIDVFFGKRWQCCGLDEALIAHLLQACSRKSSRLGRFKVILAYL